MNLNFLLCWALQSLVSLATLILSRVVIDEVLRQPFAFACVLEAYYFEQRGITGEVTQQVKHHSTIASGFRN